MKLFKAVIVTIDRITECQKRFSFELPNVFMGKIHITS